MKLPKTYEPQQYEPNIYALWESANVFAPTGEGEPFSIVMPPPNANGNLHMGHALDMNLKDIIIRYQRMAGRDAVFIPGADHAGFETWVVYEKELQKEGKSRFDFSREDLYNRVWNFVEQHRGNMEIQLRALGVSASWDDLVFTLDKKVVDTAYDTFKQLWDDGLVYRGERIVNYCTYHRTSFADIEVEHKTEKSKLWKIAYPTLSSIGEIVVATTRPETMLGDTAIAVHPDDDRYKHLIGSTVQLPLVQRDIPIVADEAVDPTFGTGAVKVTPAHDPTDFEIGERHNLPRIQVIGQDGLMTDEAPEQFRGLDVMEARRRVVAALEAAELMRGEDDYEHVVGHCYRCGTPIQPLVKDQWFLRIKPLAERAKQALQNGEINFTPANKVNVIIRYLDNLRDWNLSRQIPWGIPIPAFQNKDNPEDWIFDTRVDKPTIEVDGKTYLREEDTFDTWFSSGQWPYIVTDYLSDGKLANYYPTDLMETGLDLIDRWVSRMIMLGLYRTGKIPFKNVYFHGMVLDEKGQKMSKSKGNVLNPMAMIEEYGSDALRIGIVSARSAGQNQAFARDKVIAGRNFCNKLWNIARYCENKIGDGTVPLGEPEPKTIADHWIVRQLTNAADTVGKMIEEYRLAEAVETVYHTIWDDVADWYVESTKQENSRAMLAWVLQASLRLAHPFAPFVTESIWQTLWWEEGMAIKSPWKRELPYHEIAAAEFEQLQALVSETRFVASELGQQKQTVLYEHDTLIAANSDLIKSLANLESVEQAVQPKGLRIAVPNREAWFKIDEHTLNKHRKGLEERLDTCRETIQKLQARLDNPSYVNNAPEAVVNQTKYQINEQQSLLERLVRELEVI